MKELRGDLVSIRRFEPADAQQVLDLRTSNREFFRPWEPIRPEISFTLDAIRAEMELAVGLWERGEGYVFGIFAAAGDLVGGISLRNVVRAAWQNATLGYWIAEAYNGKGYATEAVKLATRFAFDHAHLHRVQAGTLLHNIGSQRVLEKAGYRFEGVSLRYLKINGRWQDHRMYAITIEDLEG